MCAHESLARLQLPLKCSSDQDEREGSPSPNHLALIAGRNASLRPPRPAVGRGHSVLFVNPTALGRAGAKGESLGTKAGFSWAARKRQTLTEMLGVWAPLLSALSCGALQTFPRTPVSRGGALPVVPISGFMGTLEPAGPWSPAALWCQCGTGSAGLGQAQSLAGAASRAELPVCQPCSSWVCRASHVHLEWQQC